MLYENSYVPSTMNEDLSDLERHLRRLQPTPPSERLENRLANVLDLSQNVSPRTAGAWWQRLGFNDRAAAFWWGLLSPAAAAAAAMIFAENWRVDQKSPAPLVASPYLAGKSAATHDDPRGSRAVNVLYQTLDDGVVMDTNHEPVRRVRYRSADQVRWHNAQSGAQWEVSYPREDVVLVPVEAE